MKITPLMVMLAAGFWSASAAQAQSRTTNRFTAPRTRARTGSAPVLLAPRTDGVIVRAVRSGQPFQMLNPAAPAEFGSGQDTARREPSDPYQRPQGIKLFAVEF